MTNNLLFLSGDPGSGKTHAQNGEIQRLTASGESVIYVQPSMELQRETETKLKSLGVLCTVINSNTLPTLKLRRKKGEAKVTGAIQSFLRRTQARAHCLLITWSSFERLAEFPGKEIWHLRIDEVPPVYSCFDDEHGPTSLTRLTEIGDVNADGIRRVSARSKREMLGYAKRLARLTIKGDKASAGVCGLAYRLASDHYDTFTSQTAEAEGEEGGIFATVSLLNPSIVERYRSVLIAGAEVESSPLYRHWSNVGVSFQEALDLKAKLRFEKPPNGAATTFYYVFDKEFSKTFRDRPDLEVVKWMENSANEIFGKADFLYSCNIGLNDLFEQSSNAIYLPNDSKGSNKFDHIHNCVLLSARNLKPVHRRLLMRCLDVTAEFLKTGQHRHEVLQQFLRTSARLPECFEPKQCLVPDYSTACYLNEHLPGSKLVRFDIGVADSLISRPLGRPRKYDNRSEKNKEYLKRNTKKQRVRFLAEIGNYAVNRNSMEGCDENTFNVIFSSNPFVRQYFCCDVPAVDSLDITPHLFDSFGGFCGWMRTQMQSEYEAKDDIPLLSPACFVPIEGVSTTKGRANALFANIVFLDIENGNMTHVDFAKRFPELTFFAHSTYSCTAENPRYRICIPTTSAVFPDEYAAIVRDIVQRVEKSGFATSRHLIGDDRPAHGIDPSKRNIENFFRMPCKPKDRTAAFFKEFRNKGRMPLDVDAWLSRVASEQREPVAAEPSHSIEFVPRVGKSDPRRAEKAMIAFDAVSRDEGKGNEALFVLGKELALSGISYQNVQTELYILSDSMRSPPEREKQVPEILRWLEMNGFFGSAKAA